MNVVIPLIFCFRLLPLTSNNIISTLRTDQQENAYTFKTSLRFELKVCLLDLLIISNAI